jgi:hypothetical protein
VGLASDWNLYKNRNDKRDRVQLENKALALFSDRCFDALILWTAEQARVEGEGEGE